MGQQLGQDRRAGILLAVLLAAVALLASGCQGGPAGQDGAAGQGDSAPGGAAPEEQRPQDSTPPPSLPAQEEPLPVISPAVSLEPVEVAQGDFAILQLDQPVTGEVRVSVEGLSDQPKVYLLEGKPTAFLGFPANVKPGAYPVKVQWSGGSWQGSATVVTKKFTEDRLVVTQEQQEIYYDPRQEQEWAHVFQVRSHSLDRPLWQGAFRLPLEGQPPITTYFGEIRFVNGVETGRHSGMDFGAEAGTPILAPAWGRVALAEKLIVTGWTIIIDHGMNLYTTYYHCDRLDVAPGDLVQPGQQIGLVGSTGFSTGPHLHWTATIGNTPVDPWPLTQKPPLGIRPLPALPPSR